MRQIKTTAISGMKAAGWVGLSVRVRLFFIAQIFFNRIYLHSIAFSFLSRNWHGHGQNRLRDHAFHNLAPLRQRAGGLGEPEIPAAVTEVKLFVVEPKLIENRGVQIFDVDFVFHGRSS